MYNIMECKHQIEINETAFKILNDIKNAMHHYNKALEINDKLADALAGIGRLFVAQDNDATAINYYKKAVEIMPSNTEFRFDLAMIHLNNERYDDALELFMEVVKQDKLYIEAWINYSACAYATGEIENAIVIIEEAIEDNKDNAILW